MPPVRDDDHVRGPEDAPLVVMYADFTCPRCAVVHAQLLERPVRRVFRHMALKAKHPRAVALARAAEAAGRQGAFWPFHDALYADQGRQDDPHLWALVERLGLDLDRFEADRRADDVAERVERDTREAVRAGAMHTPTLFTETLDPSGLAILTRLSDSADSEEDRPAPKSDAAGQEGQLHE